MVNGIQWLLLVHCYSWLLIMVWLLLVDLATHKWILIVIDLLVAYIQCPVLVNNWIW